MTLALTKICFMRELKGEEEADKESHKWIALKPLQETNNELVHLAENREDWRIFTIDPCIRSDG